MGGAHSREELDTSDDEEYESGSNDSSNESDDERYEDSKDEEDRKSSGNKVKTPNSMEAKLRELKLEYGRQQQPEVNVNPNLKNAVKFYVYVGGGMKQGKWMVAEKVTFYSFVRSGEEDGDVSESED